MKITYKQYCHIVDLANEMVKKEPYLRQGQALWNTAYMLHPELLDGLTATSADPFYTDLNIAEFFRTIVIQPEDEIETNTN